MTKDEFITTRFATQVRLAKQGHLVATLEAEWEQRQAKALEEPREQLSALRDKDSEEHDACLSVADFLPFKKGDFITRGDGDYYEVAQSEISLCAVEHDAIHPPDDFLRVHLRGFTVRKSGTLAQYASNLDLVGVHDLGSWRKAEMAEDIRLRRAVKHRMRRRLEGGD